MTSWHPSLQGWVLEGLHGIFLKAQPRFLAEQIAINDNYQLLTSNELRRSWTVSQFTG